MILGVIVGGLTVYIYYIISFRKKKVAEYFRIDLIYNKVYFKQKDGAFKIALLIFFAGFFDFIEYIIASFFIPKITENSLIDGLGLGSIATISSSLICTYALGFKIGRHNKMSLIALSLCACGSIIFDLLFKPDNISFGKFIFAQFLSCLYLIFISFTDCIERYLVDYNFLNPFYILMIEGILEFIMAIFYSINKAPFQELGNQYDNNSAGKFTLLIFLLILYLLFSIVVNSYKIYCNCIYSPMARSLAGYFFNPFLNIYYFIRNTEKNYFYFFINELIGILADIFACVYNEYIILFCCGFEHDTKDLISQRSEKTEIYHLNTIMSVDDIIEED